VGKPSMRTPVLRERRGCRVVLQGQELQRGLHRGQGALLGSSFTQQLHLHSGALHNGLLLQRLAAVQGRGRLALHLQQQAHAVGRSIQHELCNGCLLQRCNRGSVTDIHFCIGAVGVSCPHKDMQLLETRREEGREKENRECKEGGEDALGLPK